MMQSQDFGYDGSSGGPSLVSHAMPEERQSFLRRTYMHLAGAIFGCVAFIALFLKSPFAEPAIQFMISSNWLIVLGLFIGASWLGDWMALNVKSRGLQYLGLAIGVSAYGILLTPMILIAQYQIGGAILMQAAFLTLVVFAGMTAVVFVTGKDFSILRVGLAVGSLVALGAIVAGTIFDFNLGLGFSIAMVGLSAAMIVYQTSNMVHVYRTDQHVAAALALFSSIGMLFWYILRILMFTRD
ncbi:permease [Lujinxingia vulgaris]|uniref:Permease n=2 Tax=Lujinxingia vulgaris TaxID=2600176 RepID=A0A5C6XDV4_9DELT|nr:permease [Lujinxingia vulgaris]